MGDILNQLPPQIQSHVKHITGQSGLPDTDESYEKIAQGWLDKKDAFEKEMHAQGLVDAESLDKEDAKGGVALTYSGSLVLVGPLKDGNRKSGYNSIGMRKNVPESIVQDDASLAKDIALGQPIEFENGPVKKTSAIYKLAVCPETLALEEQEEKISDATIIITQEFIDINNALVPTE